MWVYAITVMRRKAWAPRDLDWHNQLHSYPFVNTLMGLYDLNAENPSGNWCNIENMGNPIFSRGQGYYSWHAHPLFTGYKNSWQKSAFSSFPYTAPAVFSALQKGKQGTCVLPRLQGSLQWLMCHYKQRVLKINKQTNKNNSSQSLAIDTPV